MKNSNVPIKVETRQQLGERLGVSPLTVDNWRRRGLIQPIRIGGFVRYNIEKTDQMLTEHEGECRSDESNKFREIKEVAPYVTD